MGSEVDESRPQYVEDVLAQLRNMSKFAQGQSRRDALLAIRRQLFDSANFQRARREYLKVYIAGFLYLDQSTKLPYYQFFVDTQRSSDSYSSETSGRNYVLDYQWPNGVTFGEMTGTEAETKAAVFIDSLFLVMRLHQSPWATTDRLPSGRKFFGLAEYLYHLPQQTTDDTKPHPAGESANLADGFGWHYVPYGELVFFTFAWRYCLRQAVKSNSSGPSLWQRGQWDPDSFEGELYKWLHEPDPELKDDVAEALRDGLGSVDAWNEGSDDLLLRDLYSLLIIDSPKWRGKFGVGALALLRHVSSSTVFPEQIREEARERLDQHGRATDYDPDDLRALDTLFQAAVEHFLSTSSGADNPRLRLKRLHDSSRFPVIPYFYWNALDRIPKTHAVIPIWDSLNAPVKVPVHGLGERSLTTVGVAVLSIFPFDTFDSTFSAKSATVHSAVDIGRAEAIAETILRASLPQVDEFYYGQLNRRVVESDAKDSMLASFGHDASKPLSLIESVLRSDLPEREKTHTAVSLVRNCTARFASFSTLLGGAAGEEILREEAARRNSSVSISQIIGSELFTALAAVVFQTKFRDYLRAPLLGQFSSAAAWEGLLRCTNLESSEFAHAIETGLWPPQTFKSPAERIRVECVGTDLILPFHNLDPTDKVDVSRIYSALSFFISEVIRNAFAHQYNRSDMVTLLETEGITIRHSASPYTSRGKRKWRFRIEFSPVPVANFRPIKNFDKTKTFNGLKAISNILSVLGARPACTMIFYSEDGVPLTAPLPYWRNEPDEAPKCRVWEIENLPPCAFISGGPDD